MSRIFTGLVYHASPATGNGAARRGSARLSRMSGSGSDRPKAGRETPAAKAGAAPAGAAGGRATGPVETFFSELIRRSASLGFSSLLLTEEAIRRAFSEKVPAEWVDYLGSQGEDLRREIVDRLGKEFGQWLHTQDPASLVQQVLDRYEESAQIELRPVSYRGAGDAGASLRVVARPR